MAKACQGEQGVALFSLWEAETCIKAADLLLWPHIKQAKQTGGASPPLMSRCAHALATHQASQANRWCFATSHVTLCTCFGHTSSKPSKQVAHPLPLMLRCMQPAVCADLQSWFACDIKPMYYRDTKNLPHWNKTRPIYGVLASCSCWLQNYQLMLGTY